MEHIVPLLNFKNNLSIYQTILMMVRLFCELIHYRFAVYSRLYSVQLDFIGQNTRWPRLIGQITHNATLIMYVKNCLTEFKQLFKADKWAGKGDLHLLRSNIYEGSNCGLTLVLLSSLDLMDLTLKMNLLSEFH